MSGILSTLFIGRNTLDSARAGVQLTSNNISNVNTEGFHRRRLTTSPADPGPLYGGGVVVNGGNRVSDDLLAKRVNTAVSQESYGSACESLLLQLENGVGDLGEGSLSTTIANLMAKFSALAANPDDLATRNEVLNAAQALCDTFNGVAKNLNEVADSAEKSVVATVTEINQKAVQIADLNSKIQQSEATGQEASDLRDKRDLLVSELGGLGGVTSFVDGSGNTTVLIGSLTLVQGDHAAALAATPDVALNGKSRIDLVDGNFRTDITARLDGGKLGGLINVRDKVVPEVLSQVDQLAYDMVSNPLLPNNLNAQHRAGFGLDGVGGRDLFTPLTGATGAAASLSLRSGITAEELAASSTGLPGAITRGNGENALTLAQMGNQSLAGGRSTTYTSQAANIVAKVGTESAQAQQTASIRKDQLSYLKNMQQSSDGVSLDEEMTQLVQYQRLYQAGTKIIQVMDELLAGIMGIS